MSDLEMFVKNIDVNKEASDIIFHDENRYTWTNMTTSKKSEDLSSVVRDRRFIVFSCNNLYFRHNNTLGVYIVWDKERDGLFIIKTVLKVEYNEQNDPISARWEKDETKWAFLGKDKESVGNVDDFNKSFDICGQAIIMNSDEVCNNVFVGARDAVYDFLGGPAICEKKTNKYINTFMLYFDDWESYKYLLRAYLDKMNCKTLKITCKNFTKTHFFEYNGKELVSDRWEYERTGGVPTFNGESHKLSMPKAAREQLNKVARIYLRDRHNSEISYTFSIIQKDGNNAVLREFIPAIDYKYPLSNSRIKTMEVSRTIINKKYNYEKYGCLIVYVDEDLNGTMFQYSHNLLDHATDYINDALAEIRDVGPGWNVLDKFAAIMNGMFKGRHYVIYTNILNCQYTIASNPMIESISKIVEGHEESSEYFYERLELAIPAERKEEKILDYIVGPIQEKGSLDNKLNLPAGFLDYAIKQDSFRCVKEIKAIIEEACGYPNFLCLGKEEIKKLVDFYTKRYTETLDSHKVNSFAILLELFGFDKWNTYISFLNKLRDDSVYDYEHYARALLRLSGSNNDKRYEMIKMLGWKHNKKDLETKMNILSTILKYGNNYQVYEESFKDQQEWWERYAYEDDDYFVSWPKTPEDLSIEGLKLHHCGAEFVATVARRETTILFIRKKDKPDAPYYTLEIRHNEVRQCHGRNNCKIGEKVEGFLRKFCREKNVVFTKGTELLGI